MQYLVVTVSVSYWVSVGRGVLFFLSLLYFSCARKRNGVSFRRAIPLTKRKNYMRTFHTMILFITGRKAIIFIEAIQRSTAAFIIFQLNAFRIVSHSLECKTFPCKSTFSAFADDYKVHSWDMTCHKEPHYFDM